MDEIDDCIPEVDELHHGVQDRLVDPHKETPGLHALTAKALYFFHAGKGIELLKVQTELYKLAPTLRHRILLLTSHIHESDPVTALDFFGQTLVEFSTRIDDWSQMRTLIRVLKKRIRERGSNLDRLRWADFIENHITEQRTDKVQFIGEQIAGNASIASALLPNRADDMHTQAARRLGVDSLRSGELKTVELERLKQELLNLEPNAINTDIGYIIATEIARIQPTSSLARYFSALKLARDGEIPIVAVVSALGAVKLHADPANPDAHIPGLNEKIANLAQECFRRVTPSEMMHLCFKIMNEEKWDEALRLDAEKFLAFPNRARPKQGLALALGNRGFLQEALIVHTTILAHAEPQLIIYPDDQIIKNDIRRSSEAIVRIKAHFARAKQSAALAKAP